MLFSGFPIKGSRIFWFRYYQGSEHKDSGLLGPSRTHLAQRERHDEEAFQRGALLRRQLQRYFAQDRRLRQDPDSDMPDLRICGVNEKITYPAAQQDIHYPGSPIHMFFQPVPNSLLFSYIITSLLVDPASLDARPCFVMTSFDEDILESFCGN